MRKNIELSDEQIRENLDKFYKYFKTGYQFEEFLKIYLEKLGLDEVSVTQRSRDGGIDLKAVRNGVGGFSDADIVAYYVQAKRKKPGTSISVKLIRELKGTIPFGHKGIFITTAKFSRDAVLESNNDPSKPVILIDGKALIESCIDHEIGFVFTPSFSKAAMDSVRGMFEEENGQTHLNEDNISINELNAATVERRITANDIRARILVVPGQIMDEIPHDTDRVKVSFGGLRERELKMDKGRRYLGGVTGLYREKGLLSEDGSYHPMKAVWSYADGKITISLKNQGEWNG